MGKATTFWIRFENLPWEYWLRTRALSWGLVRGLVVGDVGIDTVLLSGEAVGNRVERSLREEGIEGLNSSGLILLRRISIEGEAPNSKVEV